MSGARGSGAGAAPDGPFGVSPWPAGEEPPVPEEFAPWLVAPQGSTTDRELSRPDRAALFTAALEALARALRPEGGERGGAFDLLAADGLVTYAARAALEEESPRPHWEEMAVRLLAREGDDTP